MSRQLDLEFLEATALRRTRRGGVAQRDGQWLYRGRPMLEGLLLELYGYLVEDGLLQVGEVDEYGLRRVGLSEAGQARYRELVREQPTPLRVPPTEHPTSETGAGERRGWCVSSCGCSVDVPAGGGVHVDCPACEPTQSPAGHRQGAAPLAGDRPDPGPGAGR